MIPKFRAWEKESKEMIEVSNIHFEEGIVNYSTKENPLPWRFLSEVVLMQSTGLFDKNGVEIFEGDIGIAGRYGHKFTIVIKFGKYGQDGSGDEYKASDVLGFYAEILGPLEWYEEYRRRTTLFDYYEIEIIGNIYQNPELIKA